MSGNIGRALTWAQQNAWDETHGYNMYERRFGNPDYDCSSFVYYALQHGGFNVPKEVWSTPNELTFLQSSDEFSHFIYEPGFEFKNGDVLVYDEGGGSKGHTLFFAEKIPCYTSGTDPRIIIANARVEASGVTFRHPDGTEEKHEQPGDQANDYGVHYEVRCIRWYFDPGNHEWHIFRPKSQSNPGLLSLLLTYAISQNEDDTKHLTTTYT